MHIGKRIKELVETEGLTVTEVATVLEKTRQTVYDLYEKAHVSTEILEKLSQKYAVPLAYFFDDYFPLPATILPTQSNQKVSLAEQPPDQQEGLQQTYLVALHRIVHLQEKLLTYEQARQSFLLFLERLRDSIIQQKGLLKRLPPAVEQKKLAGTSFAEAHELSPEDSQQVYEAVFTLYDDFGVFFSSGFISDVYWKRAWYRYQQAKQK